MSKTTESIIGICLVAAEHDSHGNPIDPNSFYFVEKLEDGRLIIIKDDSKSQFDWFLKITNKLN